ncbi:MAG: hypothetical protein ACOX52_10070 [Verrucomicrobiota bacterium]
MPFRTGLDFDLDFDPDFDFDFDFRSLRPTPCALTSAPPRKSSPSGPQRKRQRFRTGACLPAEVQ